MNEVQIINLIEKLSMPGVIAVVSFLFFKSPFPQLISDLFRVLIRKPQTSFEDRVAALEAGHEQVRTNHFPHYDRDLRDIRNDIEGLRKDIGMEFSNLKERIVRLETKLFNGYK